MEVNNVRMALSPMWYLSGSIDGFLWDTILPARMGYCSTTGSTKINLRENSLSLQNVHGKLGSMKTGPCENSSSLHNVRGELVQLQNMLRQLGPNNTLMGTVSKNIFKYPKVTIIFDHIGLGSPSYS